MFSPSKSLLLPSDYIEIDLPSKEEKEIPSEISEASLPSSSSPPISKGTKQKTASQEWMEHIRRKSKKLKKQCRWKTGFTWFLSHLFALFSLWISLYILLSNCAIFILSIFTSCELDGYSISITVLSALTVMVQTAKIVFKPGEKSLYFKRLSIQYKKIYRKVVKYLYQNPDRWPELLSSEYRKFDRLGWDLHQAEWGEFAEDLPEGYHKWCRRCTLEPPKEEESGPSESSKSHIYAEE